jgi:hypothetical protein
MPTRRGPIVTTRCGSYHLTQGRITHETEYNQNTLDNTAVFSSLGANRARQQSMGYLILVYDDNTAGYRSMPWLSQRGVGLDDQ